MSKSQQSGRAGRRGAALAVTALLACGAGLAQAQVPGVSGYIGAGIGQSDVKLGDVDVDGFRLNDSDTAWKVFAGIRAASVFGAELDYISFGKTGDMSGSTQVEAKLKGLAGFGLFYLPLPLPILDVYVKAGLARLDADLKVNTDSFSDKDTQFAYGAGVQLKFGSFALRGEYERYKVEDAKPSLVTLGFSKSFL